MISQQIYKQVFGTGPNLPVEKGLFLTLLSGSESGIATTTAIIAGLVTGTNDRSLVVASAVISLIVQAFNSAIVHIHTSHTDDEIDHNEDMEAFSRPLSEAFLQFLVHVGSSFLVLTPIVFANGLNDALVMSVAICLLLLFSIGFSVGRVVNHTPFKNGFAALVLGALVIIVGFVTGLVLG